jgi:hypothetical protein
MYYMCVALSMHLPTRKTAPCPLATIGSPACCHENHGRQTEGEQSQNTHAELGRLYLYMITHTI